MPLGLVLPDLIFLAGVYVRIVVVDDRLYLMRQQPFDDRAGARRTARMQQHLPASFRYYDGLFFQ